MKEHVFRLTEGTDLKTGIREYCQTNRITSACVICCVGCLTQISLRMAGGEVYFQDNNDREIVSLTGTVSENGVHFHISASDVTGTTVGGHLKEGCIVGTTAEIVLAELESVTLTRQFDEKTGYKELVISSNK
ncbi:MAG: DNA-binding protein [Erysipelotrichaceae bacterium]|nr:DNA-binding protein [Erysipelotrichaceae bacterium]